MSSTPGESSIRRSSGPPNDEAAWQLLLVVPEEQNKFGAIRAAAKQRQRTLDKKMDHLFAVNQKVSEALRSRKAYSEVRDMIRHSKVVTEVKKEQDNLSLNHDLQVDVNTSYRDQGNLEMYTSQNMKDREQNKFHPEVREAIDSFWESLPKTQQGHINKSIYRWYSRKLFYALVPKATEEEFQRVVEEDWKNDAVWTCNMNSRMFRNAVFQLADIWCETTNPIEYRDFVKKCRDIVSVPPSYTGTREDGESTATNRRATISAQSARRRQSSFTGGFGNNTPTEAGLIAPQPMLSDAEEIELNAIENIDYEVLEVREVAWNNVIKELSDFQAQDREDDEEDVLRMLHLIQDDRFELFNDENDRAFGIEKVFMDEIREAFNKRRGTREKVDQHSKVPKPKASMSVQERTKWRRNLQQSRRSENDRLYSQVQDSMLAGIVRAREYRNTLIDLQKDVINGRLEKLDPDDAGLVFFTGQQLQDLERRSAAEAEMLDESFTLFVSLSKDFKDCNDLLLKRVADPLGADIYPNTRTGDHEILKFGSKKWPKAIDWFERFRNRRNEYLDDAIDAMHDQLRQTQFRGKNHLQAIHRQQMQFETKLIDVIAQDDTLPHEYKMKELHGAQQKKKEETSRRATESTEFDALIGELKQMVEVMGEATEERKKQEALELKKWKKVTNMDDAWAISRPVLTVYTDEVNDAMLAETMAATMTVGSRPPMNMETASLPEHVSTASDFILYCIQISDEWWSTIIAKIAGFRVEMLEKYQNWFRNNEAQQQMRMAAQRLEGSKKRVEAVQQIKAVMKDEAQTAKMSEETKEQIQNRLRQSAMYHGIEDDEEEQHLATIAEIERLKQLSVSRAAEQRTKIQKIYEEDRVSRDRFTELEALRYHRIESCFQRAIWFGTDAGNEGKERSESLNGSLKQEEQQKERRVAEEERLRRIREKREQERREMEAERLKRLEDAEKERAEIAKKKDQEGKRRMELRKRQLQERERLQAERMKREKEERQQYRRELRQGQKDREESKRLRRHHSEAKTPRGGAASPKPAETPEPTPASKPSLRRKTKAYNSAVDLKKAQETKAKVIEDSSARSRVRKAIELEVASFTNLNTQSMQINLEDFNHRRIDYFIEEASTRNIYESECRRLDTTPVPTVLEKLPNEKLQFQLNALDLTGTTVDVMTIIDVIRMNPVQTINLAKVQMDKDQCKKLCQALLNHPFVSFLDVSGNPDLGPHGGESLSTLISTNTKITQIKVTDSKIPEEIMGRISKQAGTNAFGRNIGRTEFDFLRSIFQEIDQDSSGAVTMEELKEYNDKHASLQGSRSTTNVKRTRNATQLSDSASETSNTMHKITDAMNERLDQVRDVLLTLEAKEGVSSFTLADLITFVFPSWSIQDAELLVARYSDETAAGPNMKELQEFMDEYGSKDGFLSLEQLAKGLGETDLEVLRPAFIEADQDQDGKLSLMEFMAFVSV